MSQGSAEIPGCTMIGDFEEIGNHGLPSNYSVAETVPMVMVGDFVESGRPTSVQREFKVLLHDRRIATVLGRDLKYIASESGTYAIMTRSGGEELTIALFPAKEVEGIFSGDLQLTPSN